MRRHRHWIDPCRRMQRRVAASSRSSRQTQRRSPAIRKTHRAQRAPENRLPRRRAITSAAPDPIITRDDEPIASGPNHMQQIQRQRNGNEAIGECTNAARQEDPACIRPTRSPASTTSVVSHKFLCILRSPGVRARRGEESYPCIRHESQHNTGTPGDLPKGASVRLLPVASEDVGVA